MDNLILTGFCDKPYAAKTYTCNLTGTFTNTAGSIILQRISILIPQIIV